jgi:hypothetical protein
MVSDCQVKLDAAARSESNNRRIDAWAKTGDHGGNEPPGRLPFGLIRVASTRC